MIPSSKSSLSIWLVVRSLLWTILLPGFFAGYVPWRYFGLNRVHFDLFRPTDAVGLFCIGLGSLTAWLRASLNLPAAGGARCRRSIRLVIWSFVDFTGTFGIPCISA